MEFVFGVIALLIVLFVVAGVFVTVKAVRAVQRGVERTGTQVRRTVEETTLRAKSAQPGPVGEAARTRLELRSSIDSTRRALEAGVAEDPSLSEALGLLDRLHEHARQVDGELRLLMEREPDRARLAQRLPEARERVAHIKESADSLRHAAQDRARRYDQEGLDSLRQQIEFESGALRHWEAGPGLHSVEGGSDGGGTAGPAVERGSGRPQSQNRQVEQGSQGGRTGQGGASRDEQLPGMPAGERFGKGRPQSAS